MENVEEKTMHFEPGGLSPVSAASEPCDLRASVSPSLKDGEWA